MNDQTQDLPEAPGDGAQLFAPADGQSPFELSESVDYGCECLRALSNALGVLGTRTDGVHDHTPAMLAAMAGEIAKVVQDKANRLAKMVPRAPRK